MNLRLILAVCAATLALAGCTSAPEPAPSTQQLLADGAKVYGSNCANCHMADGSGISGRDPGMVNDAVVTGDPTILIRVTLQGSDAVLPADRPKFSETMRGYPQLNDEQIAAVLTYCRHDFGKGAAQIDPAQVQAVRAQAGL